jgi:hypothetical protein
VDDGVNILEATLMWQVTNVVEEDCLVSSTTSSNLGLYLYDSTADTFVQKYATSYAWGNAKDIYGKTYLSSSVSGTGLLKYDPADKSVSLAYTGCSSMTVSIPRSTVTILTGSTTSSYFLIIDAATETVTRLLTETGLSVLVEVTGGLLLSKTATSGGIYSFVDSTKTLKQEYVPGFAYVSLYANQIISTEILFGSVDITTFKTTCYMGGKVGLGYIFNEKCVQRLSDKTVKTFCGKYSYGGTTLQNATTWYSTIDTNNKKILVIEVA